MAVQPVRRLWRCVTPWEVELAWWLGELLPARGRWPILREVESIHWLTAADLAATPDLLVTNREFLELVARGEIELG